HVLLQIRDNLHHLSQIFPVERRPNLSLYSTHHTAAHHFSIGEASLDTADYSPSDNLLGDGFDILIGADDHGRIVGQLLRYSKVVVFDGLNGMLAEARVG